MIKYVPILKWKAGEKDSIKKLNETQLEQIAPIIELVDPINELQLLRELNETGLKYAFIDNVCSEESNIDFYKNLIINADESNLTLIPVFYIEDLYDNNSLITQYNEISIRLQIPEPINSLKYKNLFEKIFEKSNTKIDIILDLIFLEDIQTATLKSVALEKTLSQLIEYHTKINKIIISSTSFPSNLNDLEAGGSKRYERYELTIFNKIHELPEYNKLISKIVYSDYGVNKFTDTEIDFSKMQYGILPKIKYTTDNFYYVQKGKKDRIRNIYTVSIFDMCDNILNSNFFYGKDFSYGDNLIHEKAIKKDKPGGNKDWVTISTVHHIIAILKQLSNQS